MWEQRREAEHKNGSKRDEDWENVGRDNKQDAVLEHGPTAGSAGASPSPADVRGLVSGEAEKGAGERHLKVSTLSRSSMLTLTSGRLLI